MKEIVKSTHKKTCFVVALALAVVVFAPATVAKAAEINPEPGTYSTGSTSEMSAYSTVTQTPGGGSQGGSSSLANTGQDAQRLALLAVALLVVGGGAVGLRYILSRKKSA